MGRFFGWVWPVVYLLTVALMVACSCYLLLVEPTVDYSVLGYRNGVPIYGWSYESDPLRDLAGSFMFPPLSWVVPVVWFVAMLWFIFQAGILHPDRLEDERWTAHMLSVGFVGRLVLMPLNVLLTLSFLGSVATFLVLPGPANNLGLLNFGLWIGLLNIMTVLPFTVYQLCGATRLANRNLMGTTALVWHAVLSFLPTAGFVSMCALFANGRSALWAEHDRRVAREAVAATLGTPEGGATAEDGTEETEEVKEADETEEADGGRTTVKAEPAAAEETPARAGEPTVALAVVAAATPGEGSGAAADEKAACPGTESASERKTAEVDTKAEEPTPSASAPADGETSASDAPAAPASSDADPTDPPAAGKPEV